MVPQLIGHFLESFGVLRLGNQLFVHLRQLAKHLHVRLLDLVREHAVPGHLGLRESQLFHLIRNAHLHLLHFDQMALHIGRHVGERGGGLRRALVRVLEFLRELRRPDGQHVEARDVVLFILKPPHVIPHRHQIGHVPPHGAQLFPHRRRLRGATFPVLG